MADVGRRAVGRPTIARFAPARARAPTTVGGATTAPSASPAGVPRVKAAARRTSPGKRRDVLRRSSPTSSDGSAPRVGPPAASVRVRRERTRSSPNAVEQRAARDGRRPASRLRRRRCRRARRARAAGEPTPTRQCGRTGRCARRRVGTAKSPRRGEPRSRRARSEIRDARGGAVAAASAAARRRASRQRMAVRRRRGGLRPRIDVDRAQREGGVVVGGGGGEKRRVRRRPSARARMFACTVRRPRRRGEKRADATIDARGPRHARTSSCVYASGGSSSAVAVVRRVVDEPPWSLARASTPKPDRSLAASPPAFAAMARSTPA